MSIEPVKQDERIGMQVDIILRQNEMILKMNAQLMDYLYNPQYLVSECSKGFPLDLVGILKTS